MYTTAHRTTSAGTTAPGTSGNAARATAAGTTAPGTSGNAARATTITMLTPAQVMRELALDEERLLAMVNDGRLPAYDLGGHLRFKALDVATLMGMLAVA